jgi:predicted TPR repeat methyltransferase
MADDTQGREKLEGAYKLRTPEDNIAYYRDFATTYDSDFVEGLGYAYPRVVAGIYRAEAGERDVPVADIGCGTGLVGRNLTGVEIDGFDIAPEMLDEARKLGVYRTLNQIDLTGELSALAGKYGAVTSSGTFTHGHLGPEVLMSLLGIGRPGALFIIGVNNEHYHGMGFKAELDRMEATGRIGAVRTQVISVYEKAGHAHSDDKALASIWRLAE